MTRRERIAQMPRIKLEICRAWDTKHIDGGPAWFPRKTGVGLRLQWSRDFAAPEGRHPYRREVAFCWDWPCRPQHYTRGTSA